LLIAGSRLRSPFTQPERFKQSPSNINKDTAGSAHLSKVDTQSLKISDDRIESPMDFAARPPSTAWEPIPAPGQPGCGLWAWFKPAAAPTDILLQVPAEAHAACGPISLRRALQMLGVPVESAVSWSVQGAMFAVQGGANPLLDQPLPSPGPWGDPAISVRLAAQEVPVAAPPVRTTTALPMSSPTPAGVGAPAASDISDERALHAFEADWHALLTLETQLSSARKQLGALQGQLQSLNRDLSPDERLAADNQDTKDWQDARRWLRDALASVSRWIRDHDIGMVSAAGNRNRFEQIYQQHVVPRRPFAGLAAACHEFEQHRKTAQHLLIQMQLAQQNASRDAVNRARQVLNRIAAKVRKAKEKRGTR
jgi:hypothetical protein